MQGKRRPKNRPERTRIPPRISSRICSVERRSSEANSDRNPCSEGATGYGDPVEIRRRAREDRGSRLSTESASRLSLVRKVFAKGAAHEDGQTKMRRWLCGPVSLPVFGDGVIDTSRTDDRAIPA